MDHPPVDLKAVHKLLANPVIAYTCPPTGTIREMVSLLRQMAAELEFLRVGYLGR